MTAQISIDADILVALTGSYKARGTDMDGLTWPQIRYWGIALLLIIAGLAAIIGAQFIPWEGVKVVVGEIGIASLIAGILAGLVEPFFRGEFARDAFLAAFRYVLPDEFKNEVGKILRNVFITERQTWRVEIVRENEETVKVTTSFEWLLENKTSTTQKKNGLYSVPEFDFPNGRTEIVECGIQSGDQRLMEFHSTNHENVITASTDEIDVAPGTTALVWGKAVQYRRTSDLVYETFGTPAVDPVIEVVISDDFQHVKEFGTVGDVEEARYSPRYQLRGVYFPGQYMLVRWWPRQQDHIG